MSRGSGDTSPSCFIPTVLEYSFPSNLLPWLHLDRHFIEHSSLGKMALVWITLKSSQKFFSCLVFTLGTSKRRSSGKYRQTPIYALIWGHEANQLKALSHFWNEMCPMHYERQARLCSIISKLSRRGYRFFFFFSSLNTFHAPRQTGSKSLHVKGMKYWHLWGHQNLFGCSGRERDKCTGSRKWLSQGHH